MSWHSRGIIRELFGPASSRQLRAEEFPSPTSQSASSTAPLATRVILGIFLIAARLSGGFEMVAVAESSELRLLAVAQVDSGGVYLHQIVSESLLPPSPIRLVNAPAFGQATSLGKEQVAEILRAVAPDLASRTWAGSSQVRITRRARALGESDLRDLLTATLQSEFVKDKGDLELRFSRPWAGIRVPEETLILKVIDLPANGISPNFIVRFELLVGSDRFGPWQVVAQARVWKEVLLARAALKRGQPLQEADFTRERRDVLSVIRMVRRKVEYGLTRLGDPHLERPERKQLRVVRAIVEHFRKSRVHVRDVELFEIVVAVKRPVRSDEIVARRLLVAAELIEWHPRHSLVHWLHPFRERNRRI